MKHTTLTILFTLVAVFSQAEPPSEKEVTLVKQGMEAGFTEKYRLFRKADTNRNRRLDWPEIVHLLNTEARPGKTSRNDLLLRTLLQRNPRMDRNGNGVLSTAEMLDYVNWIDSGVQ